MNADREYLKMKFIKHSILVVLLLVSSQTFADKKTDAKVEALNTRVQRIERVVDNQALISLSKRIETLQREVQELRGENERLNHELDTLKSRQREQYLEIDRRLQAGSPVVGGGSYDATDSSSINSSNNEFNNSTTLPSRSVPAASPDSYSSTSPASSTSQDVISGSASTTAGTSAAGTSVANTSGAVVGADSGSTSGANDAALDYKEAFTLLKLGKYGPSITSFEAFLQNHPGSKYAANAQYWLAEANYVSKQYPRALTEFSKVVEQYPASSKVADAKLKLGFTYYELGQYEQSRIELTRLRAQFPNSSVASLAQQRLERISREGH